MRQPRTLTEVCRMVESLLKNSRSYEEVTEDGHAIKVRMGAAGNLFVISITPLDGAWSVAEKAALSFAHEGFGEHSAVTGDVLIAVGARPVAYSAGYEEGRKLYTLPARSPNHRRFRRAKRGVAAKF